MRVALRARTRSMCSAILRCGVISRCRAWRAASACWLATAHPTQVLANASALPRIRGNTHEPPADEIARRPSGMPCEQGVPSVPSALRRLRCRSASQLACGMVRVDGLRQERQARHAGGLASGTRLRSVRLLQRRFLHLCHRVSEAITRRWDWKGDERRHSRDDRIGMRVVKPLDEQPIRTSPH